MDLVDIGSDLYAKIRGKEPFLGVHPWVNTKLFKLFHRLSKAEPLETNSEFNFFKFDSFLMATPKDFAIKHLNNVRFEMSRGNSHNYFDYLSKPFYDVVIDAGAAEGLFSLLMSKRSQKVIAIESLGKYCRALERTNELNGIENVIVCHAELDSKDDEEVTPPRRSLDSLMREYHVSTVSLVKMDIEGAEMAALEGAQTLLESGQTEFLVCLYHKPNDYRDIVNFFKGSHPYDFEISESRRVCSPHGRPYWRPTLLHAIPREKIKNR